MQLELGLEQRRGPVLRIAASADAAWDGAIAEWFAQVGQGAWTGELPTAVVVPTRSHVQALRARLVASGRSALGVQFLTPPYLRALLQTSQGQSLASPEHLRLLLAVAAEEHLAATPADAEQLAATSIRRTPDHLLRLLDQLGAAGWPLDAVELTAFRPVIDRFDEHLKQCGFRLFADADREALARAEAQPRQLRHLLISGFHGGHWALWHLLRAAVATAQDATISLQYPRDEAADLDAAWIGSWEEKFGEATTVETNAPPQHETRQYFFLVGTDAQEQAHAITAATVSFLADEECSRLGIVFPAAGALSRLVGSSLTRLGIPHQDAMGQRLPGMFETASFMAWMELQRSARLNALLHFLHTLEVDHVLFADIPRERAEKALRTALSDLAIDDLALLSAACGQRQGEGECVSDLVAAIKFLPNRGTFSEFLRATSAGFEQLQWHERWREIESRAGWAESLDTIFSRTLYLRWLSEIASSAQITRDAAGSHPYARVQILTAAQAEDQAWSHLILAGLNEGSWPTGGRGDFLPSKQIDAFNSSVQKVNRTAMRRGRQGEGHVAIREGKALFLGGQQERQLARAQFSSLTESATIAVALSATLIQEAAPERISNPSDFYSSLYHQERGAPLSQADMRVLRETTSRWLRDSPLHPPDDLPSTPEIEQTAVAYASRRDAGPSGEYDFALRAAPNEIKALSVSEVEALLKSPALIWMKRFLGVEGTEDVTYAWNSTVGRWTHDWLASITGISNVFTPLPDAGEIADRISAAAERKRREVLRLCQTVRKPLPDWWQSGWENALCLARSLGEILSTAEGWRWAVTEWKLEAQPIAVAGDRALLIKGRADLLLAKTPAQPASLDLPQLWIVDFKTGNKKTLALKKSETNEQRQQRAMKLVLKREALQLALYAIAARQLGARAVDVSLISPISTCAEPQLTLDDFADCAPVFAELARMQQTGVFGMRGALRGQFTFTGSYPLAMLAVDRDLLEERWERTHRALALEEERSW